MRKLLLLLSVAFAGCAHQKVQPPPPKIIETYFTHPVHGELQSTDPRYLASKKDCQDVIYKEGVLIGLETKNDPEELNKISTTLMSEYVINRFVYGMSIESAHDRASKKAGISPRVVEFTRGYRLHPKNISDIEYEYYSIKKSPILAQIDELKEKTNACMKDEKKYAPSRLVIKNKNTGAILVDEKIKP